MKVKMKTLAAGPDGLYQPGQEPELPDALALSWIEAGYAEPVKKRLETATVESPEKALLLVTHVEGIDSSHLEALGTLGIYTLGDLTGAHDGAIAKTIQGVGKATARKWILAARELLGD